MCKGGNNNLIARLRRMPGSLTEASMDLGARGWQTLRLVTLPLAATALISGALLAFGLSFDEVIVTVFTAGAPSRTAAGGMDRKAEEEPIAELWPTTTTPRGARPVDAQQARDLRDTP